jgi:hypothetical protein
MSCQNIAEWTKIVLLKLQSPTLLNKNTENYFLSLDVSHLEWVRDLLMLSAFESAKLTFGER